MLSLGGGSGGDVTLPNVFEIARKMVKKSAMLQESSTMLFMVFVFSNTSWSSGMRLYILCLTNSFRGMLG